MPQSASSGVTVPGGAGETASISYRKVCCTSAKLRGRVPADACRSGRQQMRSAPDSDGWPGRRRGRRETSSAGKRPRPSPHRAQGTLRTTDVSVRKVRTLHLSQILAGGSHRGGGSEVTSQTPYPLAVTATCQVHLRVRSEVTSQAPHPLHLRCRTCAVRSSCDTPGGALCRRGIFSSGSRRPSRPRGTRRKELRVLISEEGGGLA